MDRMPEPGSPLANARALFISSREGRTAYAAEHDREGVGAAERAYHSAGVPAQFRDADEFAKLAFGGLELVSPGVVLVSE
jgi:hypothetical protein